MQDGVPRPRPRNITWSTDPFHKGFPPVNIQFLKVRFVRRTSDYLQIYHLCAGCEYLLDMLVAVVLPIHLPFEDSESQWMFKSLACRPLWFNEKELDVDYHFEIRYNPFPFKQFIQNCLASIL